MAKIDTNNLPFYAQGPRAKLREGNLGIYCPACKYHHHVNVDGRAPAGKSWHWNGDLDHVTLEPSLLCRSIDLARMSEADEAEYIRQTKEHGTEWVLTHSPFRTVCHSFVRNGQIQYLADCTHHLAGLTVPIPEY